MRHNCYWLQSLLFCLNKAQAVACAFLVNYPREQKSYTRLALRFLLSTDLVLPSDRQFVQAVSLNAKEVAHP